jgi:hypothetical protein
VADGRIDGRTDGRIDGRIERGKQYASPGRDIHIAVITCVVGVVVQTELWNSSLVAKIERAVRIVNVTGSPTDASVTLFVKRLDDRNPARTTASGTRLLEIMKFHVVHPRSSRVLLSYSLNYDNMPFSAQLHEAGYSSFD